MNPRNIERIAYTFDYISGGLIIPVGLFASTWNETGFYICTGLMMGSYCVSSVLKKISRKIEFGSHDESVINRLRDNVRLEQKVDTSSVGVKIDDERK